MVTEVMVKPKGTNLKETARVYLPRWLQVDRASLFSGDDKDLEALANYLQSGANVLFCRISERPGICIRCVGCGLQVNLPSPMRGFCESIPKFEWEGESYFCFKDTRMPICGEDSITALREKKRSIDETSAYMRQLWCRADR